jgi:O-antigen/teichoic acid export membrane protein
MIEAAAPPRAPRGSFAREAFISLGTQLLSQALTFGTAFVMLNILPPSVKGPAELVTSLPLLLIVFGNLGLPTAMIYSRRDRSLDDVASTVLTVGLCIGSITAGIAALFLPAYFAGHRDRVLDTWHVGLILAIAPLQLSTSYLNIAQLLAGRIVGFNLIQILPLLVFITSFFGVYFVVGPDYFAAHNEAFVSALVWANVAKWTVTSIVAVALVRRLATFRPMIDWRYLKDALAFGLRPYLRDVFQYLTLMSTFYMLNAYRFSDSELGWYSMALTGQMVIWQVPEALEKVFANRVAGTSVSERKRFTPLVFRTVFFASIAIAVAIALGAQLILPIWAKGYVDALPTLRILMAGAVVFTFFKVLQADLLGRGEKNRVAGYSALAFALLTLFTVVFVGILGHRTIETAATCSAAASATVGVLVLLHYCRVSGSSLPTMLLPQRDDLNTWRWVARSLRARFGR